MSRFDLDRFALSNYNMKRERSSSPFCLSSPFHPLGHREDKMLKTVSLSAVCKENTPYFTRPDSPALSSLFSWRRGSPDLAPYDLAWNRPDLSGMTSPLSSHADCSITEDESNTLSPHIPSTFEPTSYTNSNSFPGSPHETWINVDEIDYGGHNFQSIPFSNGGSSAIMSIAPYLDTLYSLHTPVPLPSQGIPLFAEETIPRSRKRKLQATPTTTKMKNEEEQEDHDQENDAGSDYAPRPRKKARATRSLNSTKTKSSKDRPAANPNTSTNLYSKKGFDIDDYIARHSSYGSIPCPHCQEELSSKTSLIRHIATLHTRLFACTFRYYGCNSTFGSKNEWKRHVATKHLRTGYWQCEMGRCAPSSPSDQPKEFNRKDLFMQHVRRMHAPTFLKDKDEMDATIDNIARECYKHVRDPPPRSICGYCHAAGQQENFSGRGSWEHRMEHVGKHLESPGADAKACIIDKPLQEWLIRENLVVNDGTGHLVLRSIMEESRGRK